MSTEKELAAAYYDGLKAACCRCGGQETWDQFRQWGDYLIDRDFDDIQVDEGICDDMDQLNFLHFSDCMNNGGKGKKGQVLRFLHDPDELVIVADSFDEYLQMLIDQDYSFINEDTLEE